MIVYVYDGHWPRNATRVGKHVDALLGAGHRVRILSRILEGMPRREEKGNLSVARMPFLSQPTLNRILNYPLFLNPAWVWHIWKEARDAKPDCIIVRDLPLGPSALLVGKLLGVPVHYDMAEVYPLGMQSILPHELTLAIRVVRATRAAYAVERMVLRGAATTFVVSEESRLRCHSLGVPPDRVVMVGNTPADADQLGASWPVPEDVKDLAGKPVAIFTGNLFADRGLDLAIEAWPAVVRELPDATLVIFGEGRDRARLEAQVARLGLGERVRFLGWKHHSTQPAYLCHSQIGVLPYPSTPHTCTTLPNKLFDYMAAGLPVVATDIPPIRRIVDECDVGLVTTPGDPAAFAAALLRLFRDAPMRARFGQNGRSAIAGRYSWKEDERRFVEAIERFGPARPAPAVSDQQARA
jgi:glycosyltransferase involved in cell wall biosynthesis